jgi:hypothetical protein
METWCEGIHLYVSDVCELGQGTHIVKEDIDDIINNMPCYNLVQIIG